jgi:predicted NAD-dependent protein-ADP-ribosyltransferase YbiA (DUF1768 family)
MKNTRVISFTKVSLPNGWMSNMAHFAVEFEGITFPTSEHLFQWARIKDEFKSIKGRVPHIENPMKAKEYIKGQIKENPLILKHQMLSADDVNLMRDVVRLKLEQHPSLVQQLLETDDKPIFEDVTLRCNPDSSALFWGAAECCRTQEGIKPFWVGKNMLGEILMGLRSHFGAIEHCVTIGAMPKENKFW